MAGSPDAGLARLNAMPAGEARDALLRCCGSSRWADAMAASRPFASREALLAGAERVWSEIQPDDWREAFARHPRIGDRDAGAARFAATRGWSAGEQAGVATAGRDVLEALAQGNRAYEARFGHVFLVCAAGKTADEMLGLLRARLANPPDAELEIAAAEQAKITRLRLEMLLQEVSG